MRLRNLTVVGGLLAVATVVGGCSQSTPAAAPAKQASENGHSHEGWWCDEHGVPEDVCALCNKKLAARFKTDGDWCKEHDRPDSQCFACHPELEAKFAAKYEAKYGKQPPKPESEHDDHNHDKHDDWG